MKERTTLFSYLYNAISSDIKSGKYEFGEKLPSYKQLCGLYEVGIRTVKDVFAALQRDGYIKTEERRRAVVAYRQEKRAEEAHLKEMLVRRVSIVDSIYSIRPLLSEVIVQSMAVNSAFDLAQCRRIIRGINAKTVYERWRAVSNMLKRLMINFNNPLIVDMYSDFDGYINVAIFEGFKNPYEYIYDDIEKVFTEFLNDYEKGNVEYVRKCINNMMDRKCEKIGSYLERVAADYPQYASLPQKEFVWQAEKRRIYAHSEIARNIICDLGRAQFDMTSGMLPSIAALSKRYGVSTYTVKEALSVLEGLGLVDIVNGVGTRITFERVKAGSKNLKHSVLRKDCLTLLHGMQFFALTGKCAAMLAFENINPQKMQEAGRQIDYSKAVIPGVLLSLVIDGLPNPSLRNVFGATRNILNWGYYFHFLLKNPHNKQVLNNLSERTFELHAQGNIEEFGNTFADLWIFALNIISTNLSLLGIEGAEKVYVPQYNSLSYNKMITP